MTQRPPFPVLHVHLGPDPAREGSAAGPLAELVEALAPRTEVRQSAVLAADVAFPGRETPIPGNRVRAVGSAADGLLPLELRPRTLLAVGRALRELVAAPAGRRRAVQWPVPERWAVVHARGAAALRAVWLAAAWRGRNPRLLASPLPGGGTAAAGLWRKAELVAVPGAGTRTSLARRGVEPRRLRTLSPGDADAHLRLYRRLAAGERRRVQRVDWSLADEASGPRERP